ncbi:MAG TPA: pyridoxamine 5'-phosphate oxidase family protein, partial [Acidimicrobiia bacterium]
MSDKTTIRRLPEREVTDLETIEAILDEGFVCHAAYVIDSRPVVLPVLYARDGDRLLLHGSNSMGLARAVRAGSPISVAVTHVDGLVVARSSFHSSANYRSVVVHGHGRLLEDEEKARALDLVVDRVIPGRRADIRESTSAEIG